MLKIVGALIVAACLFPGKAAAAVDASRGVRLVTSIAEPGVISARAVGRYLYVSSLDGVSIYDITNAPFPLLVSRLALPNGQNEDIDVGAGILLVSDDPVGGRGVLHVIDVRDPRLPRLLSSFRTWTPGLAYINSSPPRRLGIGHTATCIKKCRYAWLAGSPAGIDVVDLRDPSQPRLAGRFRARAAAGILGTHDVQVDRSGLAWVAGADGTAAYDVSNPVRPRLVKRTPGLWPFGAYWGNAIHHNSLRIRRNVLAVTEEAISSDCSMAGTFQTWRITRRRRLRPLDAFRVERDLAPRLMCSAHYFDVRDGLVAQGFYEQGVRFIDVRRPRRLRQVGYYVSGGNYWGALFAPTDLLGEVVYALDHTRGIDVLQADRVGLRPVRRKPLWPPAYGEDDNVDPSFALQIEDGYDGVQPGQELRLSISVDGGVGPAELQVTLPSELIDIRPPAGAGFDASSRTLRISAPDPQITRRSWVVAARVEPSTPVGTQLETVGYVKGAGDPLLLDDRGVDRGVVAATPRPTIAPVAARARSGWRAFCALPSDYTL